MRLYSGGYRIPVGAHEEKADKDPEDLPDAADDADEDTKGRRQAKGGNGNDKASLLDTKLHGEEADEVGTEGGEREDEHRMEEGEEKTVGTAPTIHSEEEQHEHHLKALDDTREELQGETCIESPLLLLMEGCYLVVYIVQSLAVQCQHTTAPLAESWQFAYPTDGTHHETIAVAT